MATLSVIVATYNRSESLRGTLAALAAQELRAEHALELIIVDNRSTDRTRAVIEQAASNARWPVRYLYEATQGKSAACNTGVRAAQGAFLAFTDDDVIPEPGWAQALYDAAETLQADVVGGKIVPSWDSPPPTWMVSERLKPQIWVLLALLDRGPKPFLAAAADPHFLYGANLGFRRPALEALGPFRLDLGPNGRVPSRGEDSEMLERAFRASLRVAYTPEAAVRHRVPKHRMTLGYVRGRKYHGGRSDAARVHQRRGVHPWLVKECAGHGLAALGCYAALKKERAIQEELQFWAQLGLLTANEPAGQGSAG